MPRWGRPLGRITPVGTSRATLGPREDAPSGALDIVDFATRVFGEKFDDGCVVGEQRLAPDEWSEVGAGLGGRPPVSEVSTRGSLRSRPAQPAEVQGSLRARPAQPAETEVTEQVAADVVAQIDDDTDPAELCRIV